MEIPVDYLFNKIGKLQVELELAYSQIQAQAKKIDELTNVPVEKAPDNNI